jgi:hypothetical protein
MINKANNATNKHTNLTIKGIKVSHKPPKIVRKQSFINTNKSNNQQNYDLLMKIKGVKNG